MGFFTFCSRTTLAGVVAASLAITLGAATTPVQAKKGSCGRSSGCTRFELIHAGSTYGWYPAAKRFEFKSSAGTTPPASWHRVGAPDVWAAGKVGSGTLAVKMNADGGDAFTDWRQAHVNGRWEVRFRSMSQRDPGSSTVPIRNPSTGTYASLPGVDYSVRLELVPAGTQAQRCTRTSVLMAGYNPAARRTATIGVTASDTSYAGAVTPWSQVGDLSARRHWSGPVNSKRSAWHVWAVELRPTTITWFMDGKVTRRSSRPASTRNLAFSFRESLLASQNPRLHTAFTATQLDWARYWTLKRTTKKKRKVRALRHAPVLAATRAPSIGPC